MGSEVEQTKTQDLRNPTLHGLRRMVTLIRLLALFDAEVRLVRPWLGWRKELDHTKAERELGITITPAEQSILSTARFLA